MQLFVKKYHPDTMLANGTVHIFNDNAMMYFSKILFCNTDIAQVLGQRLGKQLQLKKIQL